MGLRRLVVVVVAAGVLRSRGRVGRLDLVLDEVPAVLLLVVVLFVGVLLLVFAVEALVG